jgi:hypothetical protein
VNASVLSYHYYCWWLKPDDEFTKETCDKLFGPKVIDQILRDVNRTGGSAMLTEWGQGCADQLTNIDVHNASTYTECVAVMALADKHFMGWTDWYFGGKLGDYGWFDNDENSENPLSPTWKLFSRPFARYIAGKPLSMTYDDAANTFDFCYIPDYVTAATVGTEIYVNFNTFYKSGYSLTTTSSTADVAVDEANNLIVLKEKKRDTAVGASLKSCLHIESK